MAKRHSVRECYYFHNYITGFVKKLENKYTTIDLRNESSVTGKIILVDGFMNLELEDAVLYDNRGTEYPFESFFIRARNIRYIHVPIDIPIINIIKEVNEPVKREKPVRKRTFKESRSYRQHQKTLAELAAASTQQKN